MLRLSRWGPQGTACLTCALLSMVTKTTPSNYQFFYRYTIDLATDHLAPSTLVRFSAIVHQFDFDSFFQTKILAPLGGFIHADIDQLYWH